MAFRETVQSRGQEEMKLFFEYHVNFLELRLLSEFWHISL